MNAAVRYSVLPRVHPDREKTQRPSMSSTPIISLRTVEKTVAGRIENLKPWPKGMSGNPRGLPKNDLAAEVAPLIVSNPDWVSRVRQRTSVLIHEGNRTIRPLGDRNQKHGQSLPGIVKCHDRGAWQTCAPSFRVG